MIKTFNLLLIILCLTLVCFFPKLVNAQESSPNQTNKSYEAQITKIVEEKDVEIYGKRQNYQKIELVITSSDKKGQTIQVENGAIPVVNPLLYKRGDRVLVLHQRDPNGMDVYFISDYIRRTPLYLLVGLFIAATIFVGRKVGFRAILGMVFSLGVIIYFILPQLSKGSDPIVVITMASLVILPVSFYMAHGFNKKTTVAIVSSFIILFATSLTADLFINAAKLSGYASEEAAFLQVAKEGSFNVKGLILAGIMIGMLGILDDITISQAAIVEQLKKRSPHLLFRDLYSSAMLIGRDHIASMVNTLFLVYAGAALPLLLLFTNNPQPFAQVINYELIAEEIVRTMVSSIGLVLAVPLTNVLASYIYSRKEINPT